MKKGITYWAFSPGADGAPVDPLKAMQKAAALGYDCFELTVDEAGPVSLEISRDEVERIRLGAEDIGIELVTLASGLAWAASPTDPDPAVREQAVKNYRKILEIASWLGLETVLYIPGMASASFVPNFNPQPYDIVDARAREALRSLLPTAEKLDVKIGVENVWNRYLLSPLEMRDFIDSFDSPFLGSYFDIGNVMLYGHPEHWISILEKRIFAVHVKDFKVDVGNLEGFVDILSGDVNFPAVAKSLKEIGYEGPLTAEVFPTRADILEKSLEALREIETMFQGETW